MVFLMQVSDDFLFIVSSVFFFRINWRRFDIKKSAQKGHVSSEASFFRLFFSLPQNLIFFLFLT